MSKPDYTYEAEMAKRFKNWNKRVYIAGPITGVPGYKKAFRMAAELVEALGFRAVDPAEHGPIEGYTYRDYIDRGLRMLGDCEFICMLPGSDQSPGAQLELHYAVLCGLPVMQIDENYTKVLGARMVSKYEAG